MSGRRRDAALLRMGSACAVGFTNTVSSYLQWGGKTDGLWVRVTEWRGSSAVNIHIQHRPTRWLNVLFKDERFCGRGALTKQTELMLQDDGLLLNRVSKRDCDLNSELTPTKLRDLIRGLRDNCVCQQHRVGREIWRRHGKETAIGKRQYHRREKGCVPLM